MVAALLAWWKNQKGKFLFAFAFSRFKIGDICNLSFVLCKTKSNWRTTFYWEGLILMMYCNLRPTIKKRAPMIYPGSILLEIRGIYSLTTQNLWLKICSYLFLNLPELYICQLLHISLVWSQYGASFVI